jgi:predicted transposase YbfD/YdcC
VRGRWGIEKGLHWRRDVLFGEDGSLLKKVNAPQVKAVLNHLALGLLQLAGKSNVAKARRQLVYDGTLVIKFLTSASLSTL